MEKPQRGALFSAVQRNLNSDTIVIADGLNYIKGFRYQMYCLAREVSARVATVGASNLPSENTVIICEIPGIHCHTSGHMPQLAPTASRG